MTEVFKTNVRHRGQAQLLITLVERTFPNCRATFDLEDCDKILCVTADSPDVQIPALISLISDFGYQAEPLPDEPAHLAELLPNLITY